MGLTMADDVRSPDPDPADVARGWITRMASGDMDGEALAAFKKWREAAPDHNRAFEQQRALWRSLEAAATTDLPSSRGAAPRRGRSPWRLHRHLPRAAAACAAMLVAMVWGPDLVTALRSDHHTGARVQHVTLPDGSLAVLDAQSALAVRYSGQERRVEVLRGAVWFQVAHGDARPFRAAALGGVTQDIGTAFEVRRQDDAVTVGVTQGIIDVRAATSATGLILRASQLARYGQDGAVRRLAPIPAGDIAVWRNDEILLHKASVSEALAAIRPYRRGLIFLLGDGAAGVRISAVFRTDRPDEALDAVAHLAGLSVYRLAGVTVLRAAL